jgi:hypothetical protein
MEAKIFDLGGADGLREGFFCPPKVPLALAVREHGRKRAPETRALRDDSRLLAEAP